MQPQIHDPIFWVHVDRDGKFIPLEFVMFPIHNLLMAHSNHATSIYNIW